MSQGLRGGVFRGFFGGIGAVLCISFIGCNDIDKPRTGMGTKQPGPGLPGTPRLSNQPASGGMNNGTAGMQTMGSGGMSAGRSPTNPYSAGGNSSFGSGASGNAIVPSVSPSSYPAVGTPPAGAGLGASSPSGARMSEPALADPGPYPPSSPDSRGTPFAPPGGSAPLAPMKPY